MLRTFVQVARNNPILVGPLSFLTGSIFFFGSQTSFLASEDAAHPAEYPFNHKKWNESFDARSIRRGFQVFKEVCSSCHGMNKFAFRQLTGVGYSQNEVKEIAASFDIRDKVPDDKGKPVVRPGIVSDYIQSPYVNTQEARYMNGGALPPDLSLVVKARDRGEDYVFSILTGYCDPPAGMEVREGLYYNPYFPGGALAMYPPLSDGRVEYPDGTKATVSQMAKDVSTFLAYSSSKEQDDRKKMGIKAIVGTFALLVIVYYHKKFRWNLIMHRRVKFE
jgi:ubiquinol-cytochrome c reductase cytochrome c1 subunit